MVEGAEWNVEANIETERKTCGYKNQKSQSQKAEKKQSRKREWIQIGTWTIGERAWNENWNKTQEAWSVVGEVKPCLYRGQVQKEPNGMRQCDRRSFESTRTAYKLSIAPVR